MLALLLGVMILLAPAQIVLRNFFDTSLTWGDPVLRLLVLWVGLLGALAASRGDKHISIDVLSRVLPARAGAASRLLVHTATAMIAGVVSYHGVRFVSDEFHYGGTAIAGIPVWLCESVIPFAFGMIAVRYLLMLWVEAEGLRSGQPSAP